MLGQHLRNLRRWNQILQVLASHGFAGFLGEIGLGDTVAGLLDRARIAHDEAELMRLPTPVRLRRAMEELGPTFIKLGQVLSTRRDLVPDAWAKEFEQLQSDCPRIPFDEIEAALKDALGPDLDRLFESIDEVPLAAASMAQAHRAVLCNGRAVVLKVLRPGIRPTIEGDMEALRFIARLAEEHLPAIGFDPVATVEEFARELSRETDLEHEARSTERLAGMFEDDPDITFPEIHWEATTRDVLCEDLATGRLLAGVDVAELSAEVRRAIVENGSRAVFHQTLEVGFFHADPHPGNMFVHDDGSITFIDCGMTGFVDEATRLSLAEIVYGVVRNDSEMVMRAALSVADADVDDIDLKAAQSDVQRLVSRFVGVPLERIDLGGVLDEFFQTLRRHDLRCPPDIVLLIKAMGTIEGVATAVDPTFDLVSFTQPYIERLLKARFSPQAVARRVREGAVELVRFGEALPGELTSLFRRLRKNRLRLQLDVVAIEDLVSSVEDASERLGYAILIASLVMASAILVLASDGKGVIWLLGLIGFIASATLAFGLIINSWRRRRRLRKLGRKLRQARGER
ncbi:MAG: AarF/UbiB family protein [Planctomycetota bacterium]|nr:AarF/UbiB family protein [Planctomycetota bacterium]